MKKSMVKFILLVLGIIAVIVAAVIVVINILKSPEEKYINQIENKKIESNVIDIEIIKSAIDKIETEDGSQYVSLVNEQLASMKEINAKLVTNVNKVNVDSSLLDIHQNLRNYTIKNEAIIIKMEELIVEYDKLNQLSGEEELEGSYRVILQLVDDILSLTKEANTYKNLWLDEYKLLNSSN